MEPFILSLLLVFLTLILAVIVIGAVIVLRRQEMNFLGLRTGIADGLNGLRLGEAIGQLGVHAEEMKKTHRTLEQMLRTPFGRGSFGEQSLQVILENQLPPDCYGVRKQCVDGKIPDAYIRAGEQIICIDSKFPLENYQKMMEADDYNKENCFQSFLRDVKRQLEKVETDYIKPDKGTASFALVFIPSEAVYHALVTDNAGYALLHQYAYRGVQVVSPLLLAHKIEILKMGIHAVRLNECAEQVRVALQVLGSRFRKLDKIWKTFTNHLRRLMDNSSQVDSLYLKIRSEFARIKSEAAAPDAEPNAAAEISSSPLRDNADYTGMPHQTNELVEFNECDGDEFELECKGDEPLEQNLLARIPPDGSSIGNYSLIRMLGWNPETFWKVRYSLIKRGDIIAGRGRGGSVRRVPLAQPSSIGVE